MLSGPNAECYDRECLIGEFEMSDKELSVPSGSAGVPAFLQDKEVLGTDLLAQYVRPPRLKIVQAQSGENYQAFQPGEVLLVPQMMKFAGFDAQTRQGEPFLFVPLFFYPEWVQTNPIGESPFILDRSLDPKSDLAAKARNRDTWKEAHPDKPGLEVTNREHLNFIVMPYRHPMQGNVCCMTFARAEYKIGSNLAGLIKMRRQSIFAQVFSAHVSRKSNDKGNWFGFNVSIPEDPESKWITEEEFGPFKDLYESFKEVYKKGTLQVDYDDPDDSPSVDEGSTEF